MSEKQYYTKPEHQASNYQDIEVTTETFRIFEELYQRNNNGESRSEFLNILMRNYIGKRHGSPYMRNLPEITLSDETLDLLESARKRKVNQNRRVDRALKKPNVDLKLDSRVFRFEIQMAIVHTDTVNSDIKNSFKELEQFLTEKWIDVKESDYKNMLIRKYKKSYGEGTRDNIRKMVLNQAEDYSITRYFNDYFFTKTNKSGDTAFAQAFRYQVKVLLDKGLIKEDRNFLVPNRNYLNEMRVSTPENLFTHSFYSLGKTLGILQKSGIKEDEILIAIRRYFGGIDNHFI